MPKDARPQPQPRRRHGRNPELSRAEILKAATFEFGARGFDGARVDRIAKSAGVNINLVYHYFENKEGLYSAVLEGAYVTIREHHNDLELRGKGPIEGIGTLVRATFRLFSEQRHLIGLLNSENIKEAKFAKRLDRVRSLYNPLLGLIQDLLRVGEESGRIRPGVDPVELFVTINGLCYFHLSNRYTLGFILDRDMDDPAVLAAREEHVVAVILSFLQFRSAPTT